jgi:hypothetical protein
MYDGIYESLVALFIAGCVVSGIVAVILWNIGVWLYRHVQITWGWV